MQSYVLWSSLAALAAAILSALVTSWLKRSKPWIAITSIHRDDTQLVPVPDSLVTIVNSNPWFPMRLQHESPLRRIIEAGEKASSSVESCKGIIAVIEETRKELAAAKGSGVRTKQIVTCSLMEHSEA